MIGGALITLELIALAALLARAVAAFAEDCCAEHEGVKPGGNLCGGGEGGIKATELLVSHSTRPQSHCGRGGF